ncbi:Spy/CpxP family protein refolding chaperone [Ramlibacter sp. AN1015]|uniref:Spy/CpxP family protein refolding chaperone n=1 Tax=Ramlibacter sp. AN1015 TaxID=3133428 RepID=UPI0030BCD659
MTRIRTSLVLAAVLAALTGGAGAQPAPAPAEPAQAQPHAHGYKRMDPAQRQERFERRMTELKQQLQITPAQENAWVTFTGALRPQGTPPQRLDREALASMTTPQRIERMRALRDQRLAAMDRRENAAIAFYAVLNPEQQKTFDTLSARMHGGGKGHGHPGHRGHMDHKRDHGGEQRS